MENRGNQENFVLSPGDVGLSDDATLAEEENENDSGSDFTDEEEDNDEEELDDFEETDEDEGVDEDSDTDEESDDEGSETSSENENEEADDSETSTDSDDEDEDDSEFDYLFPEENQETEGKSDSEVKTDDTLNLNKQENLEDWEKNISPQLVVGSKEYFSGIKKYAAEAVKQATGEEYDSFDDDHKLMFDHYVGEAKQLINEKRAEVKSQHKYETAKGNAEAEIDKILTTPELQSAYASICGNMKVKQFNKMQKEALAGDFSGFIKLAKKTAKVKSKVRKKLAKNSGKGKKKPKKTFISEADELAALVGLV